MFTKKKNTTLEVLVNLIENEMEVDDFKGVAKILYEDYTNELINAHEFSFLIDKLNEKMNVLLVRCER